VHVPAQELGDTIMKVFNTDSSRLSVLDYFTPYNQSALDGEDSDVGSGGVLLLPDQSGGVTHELVEAGKAGSIYLIDRDQMTAGNLHYCQSGCNGRDSQITQEIQSQINGLWSAPAYFNNTVYFCGAGDTIKGFPLSNGLLSTSPTVTSGHLFSFPGCTPVASANGNTNGIIWAVDTSTYGNAGTSLGPAVLYAYDAGNLLLEYWDSTMAANNRDQAGNAVKFVPPTVANGKVYVSTRAEVDVYGLLP